jgi:hypothetical protein
VNKIESVKNQGFLCYCEELFFVKIKEKYAYTERFDKEVLVGPSVSTEMVADFGNELKRRFVH